MNNEKRDNSQDEKREFERIFNRLKIADQGDKLNIPEFNPEWLDREPACRLPEEVFKRKKAFPSLPEKRWLIAATLLIALFTAPLIYRQATGDGEASNRGERGVVVLPGSKSLLLRRGESRPLFANQTIKGGDNLQIRAGGSAAELLLTAKIALRLFPSSELKLKELSRTGEAGRRVIVRLESGRIASHAHPLNSHATYQIETPHLVATVVGTIFLVEVDDTRTILTALKGEVQISEPGDAAIVIVKRNQSYITGSKLPEARELTEGEAGKSEKLAAGVDRIAGGESSSLFEQLNSIEILSGEDRVESELVRKYGRRIENVELLDGRRVRGVVVAEKNGKIFLQSTVELYIIDRDEIKRVFYER